MSKSKLVLIASTVLLANISAVLASDVAFNRHYTSKMVIQRDKPALIRGTAEKGAKVKVTFAGQSKEAKADDNGSWSVTLDALPASSKGAELTASSKGKTVKLSDVLVGDVFLFARQTTIDISLGRDVAGKKAASDVPSVRVMTIRTIPAYTPQQDLAEDATSGWRALSRETALKMDAAASILRAEIGRAHV